MDELHAKRESLVEVLRKNAKARACASPLARAKRERLVAALKGLGKTAIAFSAGVDSTFLLAVAHEALGDNLLALTAKVSSFQQEELEAASAFCRARGIRHAVVEIDQLAIHGFKENPPDRCYLCKRHIFREFQHLAFKYGVRNVCEGTNADDVNVYRPGLRAIAELGIHSPLKDAGLSKREIRLLSKEMGLPTWSKPSMTCLATRFEYGELLTAEKLSMVEKAEQRLHEMGFQQVRVRCHGKLARIEIEPFALRIFLHRKEIDSYLQELGFSYVTLDLGGYKSGSMDKELLQELREK